MRLAVFSGRDDAEAEIRAAGLPEVGWAAELEWGEPGQVFFRPCCSLSAAIFRPIVSIMFVSGPARVIAPIRAAEQQGL